MNAYAIAATSVFSLLAVGLIAVFTYDQTRNDSKFTNAVCSSTAGDTTKKIINFLYHCRNIAIAVYAVQSITSNIALASATSKNSDCCTISEGYDVTCVDDSEYDDTLSGSSLSTFFTFYSLLAFATVLNLARLSKLWKFKWASLGYLYSMHSMRTDFSHKFMVVLNLIFALCGLMYALSVMLASDGGRDEISPTIFAFITLCFMILEFYSTQELEVKINSESEYLKDVCIKMTLYDVFFQDATTEVAELEDALLHCEINAKDDFRFERIEDLLVLDDKVTVEKFYDEYKKSFNDSLRSEGKPRESAVAEKIDIKSFQLPIINFDMFTANFEGKGSLKLDFEETKNILKLAILKSLKN